MEDELEDKFDHAFGTKTTTNRRKRATSSGIFDKRQLSSQEQREEERRRIEQNAFLKWMGLLTASGAPWLVGEGLKLFSKTGDYAVSKSESAEKMASKIRAKYGRNARRKRSRNEMTGGIRFTKRYSYQMSSLHLRTNEHKGPL